MLKAVQDKNRPLLTRFLFWTSEQIFLQENNFRKIHMILNFLGRIWHFLRAHHIYECSPIQYLWSFFLRFAFLDATWCITVSQQLVVLEKYAPTRWYWTQTTDAQQSLFYWNPELLSLGRQIGPIDSEAFLAFSAKSLPAILAANQR